MAASVVNTIESRDGGAVGYAIVGVRIEIIVKEIRMNSRHLWRIALIAILSLALSRNTSADTLKSNADNIIIGVVAAVAVVVVVVAVLIHRSAKQKTVTGCVVAAQSGMSVTDEKNKRVYRLSGDTKVLNRASA
jgi:hypothetical protein